MITCGAVPNNIHHWVVWLSSWHAVERILL